MQRKSFAGRLSLKIIIITSVFFLLSIAVIAVNGSRLTKRSAIDYSAQTLLTSSTGIELMIRSIEQIANSLSNAIEAYQHNGYQLDTVNYFPLLENMLANSPHILGCGVYYEPYSYNRKSKIAGVYVSRDPESGETTIEWDDDESFAEDSWDYFGAEWYSNVVTGGEAMWIPPFIEYLLISDSRYMTTYSVPLKDSKGKVFGVCAFDISLDWLQEELLSMRPYSKSNVFIVDRNGDYICNPLSAKPYEGNLYDEDGLSGRGLKGNILDYPGWETQGEVKTVLLKNLDLFCVANELNNGWVMIISNHLSEAFADRLQVLMMLSLIALFGIIFLFFASRRIIYREASPIVKFAEAAGKITDGRFDVPIPEVGNEDEISELGNALRYMQTSVTKYIEELTVTTSEKERLAGELDVARKIQKQMLSTDFPQFSGSGIFASSVPARQVGGDLYDFYVKGNTLFFIVADVSGKGVPAALLMSISISAFRAAIRNRHTMAEIISVVNRVFCRSNDDMMFITAVAGSIDLTTGEMEVCNAGHNPMVLIKPDGEASFVRLKNNLACGVFADFEYESENLTLPKGSRLIIYTDGVTEAENAATDQYGEDRLLEFARCHGSGKVKADSSVIEDLTDSVAGFVNGAEQFDDITMMSVTV